MEDLHYYVYVVFVEKKLKYIGKGKGKRYEHPTSGCSHVFGLNRDYFESKLIEVGIAKDRLSEPEALKLEYNMILQFGCSDNVALYNTSNNSFCPFETYPDMTEKDLYEHCNIIKQVKYDSSVPYKLHPFYRDANRGEESLWI